ncbi:MAG: hypothetical protein EOP84_18370 [Verrucomicrobiaceae bacterium]|nr:MAG: hypothetical protein EOP84_18370 [Verrucomicrobiaceae bacterium]
MPKVPHVEKGRIVRLYEENDWFWQGKVSEIDPVSGVVDVDYGDWIQRYPHHAIRLAYVADGYYEEFLAPFEPGETIADYRD